MRGFLLLLVLVFLSSAVYGTRRCKRKLKELEKKVTELENTIEEMKKSQPKAYKRNCAELYKSGQTTSGVYTINPDGCSAFDVFCDQTSAGGGWTVFQKRMDGSVDFFLNWTDYKNGFGNLDGEFWLGLDKIYRLSNSDQFKLLVELEDWEGNTFYAEYDGFDISKPSYRLHLGTYNGTAGDSLSIHNGYPFTTKDHDNDGWNRGNCAAYFKGAWWYERCLESNLNGLYHQGGEDSPYGGGIVWISLKGFNYSFKRAEMKVRPVEF